MEERIFMDKQEKPTGDALQEALGSVFEQYKKLDDITSAFKKDWTFTKTGGWMLKVSDAKKALFYILPFKQEFKISMAIRENERDLFLQEKSLSIFHESLQSAKKFSEGYALQFMITNEADYLAFESLVKTLISLRS